MKNQNIYREFYYEGYVFRPLSKKLFHQSFLQPKRFLIAQMGFVKIVFLKLSQNPQENTCARHSLFFNKVEGLTPAIKKKTLTKVFSCEFCEVFKNPFFIENLRWLLLVLP